MREKQDMERRTLFYARLACLFCAAVLGLVLVAAVKIVPEAVRLIRHTEESLRTLDSVAEHINAMADSGDFPEWTKVIENLSTLSEAAEGFQELDWNRLNHALEQLDGLDPERLNTALSALDGLDLNSLRDTIEKLNGMIEPLSRFAGVFR